MLSGKVCPSCGILGLALCQNIQAFPHIVLQSMTFSINVVLSIIYTMSLCLFNILYLYMQRSRRRRHILLQVKNVQYVICCGKYCSPTSLLKSMYFDQMLPSNSRRPQIEVVYSEALSKMSPLNGTHG